MQQATQVNDEQRIQQCVQQLRQEPRGINGDQVANTIRDIFGTEPKPETFTQVIRAYCSS